MNPQDLSLVHTGIIIEEGDLTLAQLCKATGVHADWIIGLVEEGIIEPRGAELKVWRFSSADLVRARSARRLQIDLGVNLAGIGLALDLLEEIEKLHKQLNLND